MTDALTLDVLRDLQKKVQEFTPLPMFASSEMFPKDEAISFTGGGRKFFGAHPNFWKKIPPKYPNVSVSIAEPVIGIGEVKIHNVDIDRRARIEFFEGLAQAFEQFKSEAL